MSKSTALRRTTEGNEVVIAESGTVRITFERDNEPAQVVEMTTDEFDQYRMQRDGSHRGRYEWPKTGPLHLMGSAPIEFNDEADADLRSNRVVMVTETDDTHLHRYTLAIETVLAGRAEITLREFAARVMGVSYSTAWERYRRHALGVDVFQAKPSTDTTRGSALLVRADAARRYALAHGVHGRIDKRLRVHEVPASRFQKDTVLVNIRRKYESGNTYEITQSRCDDLFAHRYEWFPDHAVTVVERGDRPTYAVVGEVHTISEGLPRPLRGR